MARCEIVRVWLGRSMARTMPCAWKWRAQELRKMQRKKTMLRLLEVQNIGADGVFGLRAGTALHLIIRPRGVDHFRNQFGMVRLMIGSDRESGFIFRKRFLGARQRFRLRAFDVELDVIDRKSTRLNSSHLGIS